MPENHNCTFKLPGVVKTEKKVIRSPEERFKGQSSFSLKWDTKGRKTKGLSINTIFLIGFFIVFIGILTPSAGRIEVVMDFGIGSTSNFVNIWFFGAISSTMVHNIAGDIFFGATFSMPLPFDHLLVLSRIVFAILLVNLSIFVLIFIFKVKIYYTHPQLLLYNGLIYITVIVIYSILIEIFYLLEGYPFWGYYFPSVGSIFLMISSTILIACYFKMKKR